MDDDQQFCLRWNNHQSTLVQNFDTLLESGTLVDCTLAAEGRYLKAHKVVLSACSPYFEGLLSEHYDKHPIFILKDVTFNELKAMMDYMYRGEVNIGQDQLTPLLKAAESLQIRGLSDNRTGESRKADSRPQKTVSQPTAPSLDIPHTSSGLTIEKNRVPRQSITQGSVGDLPEDTASPQVSKGISSREGSQSPTPRRKKRLRRRSVGDDNTTESQDASNSSDMPQQMGGPSLGIAPVAEERVHADPTDSLGRSALMTQLTKPADEMLQLPLEKPEPSDNLVEPKSEYLEEPEEGVEDLTLDDDMNDLNEMEQDNNRAGPSHDSSQHPAGLGAWHVTGDRSNAGGVVGSVGGAPGTDEVFLAAQEAVQAHRDSQELASSETFASVTLVFETIKLEPSDSEMADSETIKSEPPASEMADLETIKSEPSASETINSESPCYGTPTSGTPQIDPLAFEIHHLETTNLKTIDLERLAYGTPASGTPKLDPFASETPHSETIDSEMSASGTPTLGTSTSGTPTSGTPTLETIKSKPSASETADSDRIDLEWIVYRMSDSGTIVFETFKSELPASKTTDSETIDARMAALETSASQLSASDTRFRTFPKKNLIEALDAITHGMTLREASKTYCISKTSLLRYCKKLIPDSMRRTSKAQCSTSNKPPQLKKQT